MDKEEIRRIAVLSQILLTTEQEEEMVAHLDRMLVQTEVLNRYNTSAVPPTVNVFQAVNVLREDIPEESLDREVLLSNAPESDGVGFIVPRVVE